MLRGFARWASSAISDLRVAVPGRIAGLARQKESCRTHDAIEKLPADSVALNGPKKPRGLGIREWMGCGHGARDKPPTVGQLMFTSLLR